MTLTAKKHGVPDHEAPRDGGPRAGEDITVERKVAVPQGAHAPLSSRLTTRMPRIDARLLAIARGDAEPEAEAARWGPPPAAPAPTSDPPFGDLIPVPDDDPFGGLIPVDDDGNELETLDEQWLLSDEQPAPASSAPLPAITYEGVPHLRLPPEQIAALPIGPRSGFLLPHVDGHRTVEELVDECHLSASDTLDVLVELLRSGAIELR